MPSLNLGIVAHVDAGKTTLTERLLYAAGVIDAVGSVDKGTTQTDSLALERQRGITIKAAVVSFAIDGVTVNLIDTPGHPDFIAEVERSLGVLDGAVLVISAVEGVQPQTVVLMRALRRLAVPTLFFVNKVDRAGADGDRVVGAIRERLTAHVIEMGTTVDAGSRQAAFVPYASDDAGFRDHIAEVVAEHDDDVLAAVVDDGPALDAAELRKHLSAETAAALVHPVLFGSAITGAGVPELMDAIVEFLPSSDGDADPDTAPSGTVFKIERGAAGEKVAYARMFSGTVRVRDRVPLRDGEGTVTRIEVFDHGGAVPRTAVTAGEIAKLHGLRDVRVGDHVGVPPRASDGQHLFAAPSLETAVVPRDGSRKAAVHSALAQMAEQDPLIDLRQDDVRQELFLSLYGEVQKEVIQQTLAAEFGLDIEFRETTTICVERPRGVGEAIEVLRRRGNPFLATIGLRVEPGPVGSGLEFRLAVDVGGIPMYVYKSVDAFRDRMEEYVTTTLQQGLRGWQVTDAVVTMTESGYPPNGGTSAGDFRKLTPLVLMAALKRARTAVCEPVQRFHLDAPAATLPAVLGMLPTRRALPEVPVIDGAWCALEGRVPAAELQGLQQELRGITRGEGVLEATFDRYERVAGPVPIRPRTDYNPLNRKEYLLHVLRGL